MKPITKCDIIQVENGWILREKHHDFCVPREYVFVTAEAIAEFVKANFRLEPEGEK